MRSTLVLAIGLAACFSPTPPAGSPCENDRQCPHPLVCANNRTCQSSRDDIGSNDKVDAGVGQDGEIADSPISAGACAPGDPTCEVNDRPEAAIDITVGGTFSANLLVAHDDLPSRALANRCNSDGGREVFYQVVLTAPQVYYFDTLGSGFDNSIRVFPGTLCASVGNTSTMACNDDACGGGDAQVATALPAGTSCVVVDKNVSDGTNPDKGTFQLHVIPGGRNGTALPTGTTVLTGSNICTNADVNDPGCGNDGGRDLAYFFTSCPSTARSLRASTCDDVTKVHFDTVLSVRALRPDAAAAELVCEDDSAGCPMRPDRTDKADGSIISQSFTGAGLYWLVLDGFTAGACGGFQLNTTLGAP
jgi:hypothetical protein